MKKIKKKMKKKKEEEEEKEEEEGTLTALMHQHDRISLRVRGGLWQFDLGSRGP